jgi:hypothetical protein
VVWQGPIPQDDLGARYDLILHTINGYHGIPFRSANEVKGSARLNLMQRMTQANVNTVSVSKKMQYDIVAYVQQPLDTDYRLSGWQKNAKAMRANVGGNGGHDGNDGEDDGDGDDGGSRGLTAKSQKKGRGLPAQEGKGASRSRGNRENARE